MITRYSEWQKIAEQAVYVATINALAYATWWPATVALAGR